MAFALTCGVVLGAALAGRAGDALSRDLAPATQASVVGAARVVDGDTVVVAGVKVRLEGIDAPEAGQRCGRKWIGDWNCGAAATEFLADLVKDREIRCEHRGTDRYGRMLGICYLGDLDLNREMVRRGLAWAFIKYSRTYVDAETEARTLRLGIWEGESTPAWIYRARAWQTADAAAPGGCAIKGNVSRKGRIYHMPWSPWYTKVVVDEAKGERWFCNEEEAIAAGWRPAYVR